MTDRESVRSDEMTRESKGKVLILVENLPVPFDRRVWAESLALTEAGYKVSVICPAPKGYKLHEVIDGVSIYRYPAPAEGRGFVGYVKEYAYSMWAAFRLSLKVRKLEGFDVIQGCNPPDMFYAIARFHRLFSGSRYVFDHHDLSPELFAVRFDPERRSLAHRVLLWLERSSFAVADVVMSTNESFRAVAIKRGRKAPESVFVVRNGPDLSRFRPVEPNPEFRQGREHMVCYVGVMAAQDGLDHLVRAIAHVVNVRGRKDVTFTLVGSGDLLDELKQMAKDLGVEDYVVFTGRVNDDVLLATYLSTADVCVAPEPKNLLNDKSTFIKIAEYMAIGKPIVSFGLEESQFSAQDAAVYAEPNDDTDFGDKIIELLDDPEKRKRMGEFARARVVESLSWQHSKSQLLLAYERAFAGVRRKNR